MKLYPEIRPRHSEYLAVGDGHELYLEESGNPRGMPVVVLHGGPGGASSPRMRRYFDPRKWRIILFDQRGAGRSRPSADLQANTTAHLIADMETIRRHLGVDRWLLLGGSWGATLALLYAQAHVSRCLGLVLRGIFLIRRRDLDWLFRDGASRVFPDAWADLVAPIPVAERGDLVGAYHRRLVEKPGRDAETLARRWAAWEAACSTLTPNDALRRGFEGNAMPLARIECHYSFHEGFIADNAILDGMPAIEHLPARIVHGRYDMVCPLEQSLAVHRAWPGSELAIIDDAGHSALEPGIEQALLAGVRYMEKRL